MNEEEKEAIKILNNINLLYCGREDERAIKTILNLIDKQQEEIKARLEEIDSLYKMISTKDDEIEQLKEDYQILKDDIEGHRIAYVDTPEFEEKYISKDKIKEQIRMVEETKRKGKGIDNYSMHYCIMRLKELLGE